MKQHNTILLPLYWRVWHSTVFAVGSLFFFIGSVLLFPFFQQTAQCDEASAWLYVIGSLGFVLADATEWVLYEPKILCKPQSSWCLAPSLSINIFISMIANTFFVVGSVMFLPEVDLDIPGYWVFVAVSALVVFIQAWKIGRVIHDGKKYDSSLSSITSDIKRFFVDLFAGFGGLLFFVGSFLFIWTNYENQIVGTIIFILGGLSFCISSCFMMIRYFGSYEKKNEVQINLQKLESSPRINMTQLISQKLIE